MTTLERTWTVETGIDIGATAEADSLLRKCHHMLALKAALIAVARPAPWTVAGSGGAGAGGGGGMDAVDRWTAIADLDATGNWVCLRGPAGTEFADVWFTLIDAGTYQTGRVVVSDEAPTGGDETTPPTFGGFTIDEGNADFNAIYDGTARPYKLTIGMSDQGGWWATYSDGTHVFPTTLIAVLEVSEGKTGDMPCALMHYAGSGGATTARQTVALTAQKFRMYDPGGVALCSVMVPQIPAASLFAAATGFDDDQWESGTQAPDFPAWVYAYESGKRSFRGRLVDVYLAPDGVAQNTLEPVGGPYESAVWGAFWMPGVTAAIEGYASAEILRQQFLLPEPDVDSAAPTVTVITPAAGSTIASNTAIVFDVADETALAHIEVRVSMGDTVETVYDGSAFVARYTSSTYVAPRFTVTRTGGWTNSPTFSVTPVDTSGNKA